MSFVRCAVCLLERDASAFLGDYLKTTVGGGQVLFELMKSTSREVQSILIMPPFTSPLPVCSVLLHSKLSSQASHPNWVSLCE